MLRWCSNHRWPSAALAGWNMVVRDFRSNASSPWSTACSSCTLPRLCILGASGKGLRNQVDLKPAQKWTQSPPQTKIAICLKQMAIYFGLRGTGSRLVAVGPLANYLLRLRRVTAMPTKPKPRSARDAGSGTLFPLKFALPKYLLGPRTVVKDEVKARSAPLSRPLVSRW